MDNREEPLLMVSLHLQPVFMASKVSSLSIINRRSHCHRQPPPIPPSKAGLNVGGSRWPGRHTNRQTDMQCSAGFQANMQGWKNTWKEDNWHRVSNGKGWKQGRRKTGSKEKVKERSKRCNKVQIIGKVMEEPAQTDSQTRGQTKIQTDKQTDRKQQKDKEGK